ncbi:MAG: hypothetical protein O9285_08825 [Gemmatimonas sp.]|nr:hypothetical protein [Gemmatimonas sp.]
MTGVRALLIPTSRAVIAGSARLVLLLCAPALLAAQGRKTTKEIGRTSIGTPTTVLVEPGTVSRAGTVVTAAVRVALVPPLKHPKGELRSSRTIGMYDCAKRVVATKESWYYLDEAGTKEGMHRQVKIPGFGPVAKGSVADVALTWLCAAKP